jgi:hypothetical protein
VTVDKVIIFGEAFVLLIVIAGLALSMRPKTGSKRPAVSRFGAGQARK